ncbi:MAG: Hsp70 family protein [Candidatus Omnitrophota bacterium]|jgi:molecular chaperone DnaK
MSRRTIDFGIDLGTTNSEIACRQDDSIRIFKNNFNEEYTPSVVRIDEKGTIFVGRKAYERHVDDPDNSAIEFKRWMGTQQVKEFKASNKKMTPEELSAEVLKDLKRTAKIRLSDDEDISAAVITVPCNFEDNQCEATQRAAKLAGIKYAPLLQEPIAASVAYGFLEKMPKGYWVVYDLGGGTFDIAIMSAKEGRLSVVEHCGDNYLGGKDFDWKIVENFVYPILKKEYHLPGLSRENKEYGSLNAVLKACAEKSKIELSNVETADIVIYTGGSRVSDKNGKVIDTAIPLKRSEYESLIADYVDKTIQLFGQALKNQGLTAGDITQLLLVGGPTMTPYIRNRLKEAFRIPIDYKIDPLTVVAQGAAIFAATQLMPDELTKRDYSKAFIKLAYSPMTTEKETMVGGKIEQKTGEKLPDSLQVQISKADGTWQSGMLGVKDNSFFVSVPLNERKLNTFNVSLFDKTGNKVPSEPESFSITQGISVAEPPLTRSIGVELEDGSFDKLLPKGTALPARSRIFSYQTTKSVRPSEIADALNIYVREGESGFASRNRNIGILKITGAEVNRTVPDGSKIDIVISVDKSRTVTAQAYIEHIDQTIKGILKDKVAPKPDPVQLGKDLEKEEKRFMELCRNIQNMEDPSLEEKLKEARVEDKITEIKTDVDAAKGGDHDAVEKADRRLKDLQILLDPLEHLMHWPVVLNKFNVVVADCDEIVNSYGDNDDKDQASVLKKEAEVVIKDKDTKKLEKMSADIIQMRWDVLFKQPGFWIGAFQDVKSKPIEYTDSIRAKELVDEGNLALQRQDLESLKSIMWQLWGLMPKKEQDEVGKRVSDAGIRRA